MDAVADAVDALKVRSAAVVIAEDKNISLHLQL
jgi:hypothetical protein